MRFVPAYDLDNVPQQIRIVFDSMPGYVPHGAGGAEHSTMPCESATDSTPASASTAMPGPPSPARAMSATPPAGEATLRHFEQVGQSANVKM